jgi:hypothetical protein
MTPEWTNRARSQGKKCGTRNQGSGDYGNYPRQEADDQGSATQQCEQAKGDATEPRIPRAGKTGHRLGDESCTNRDSQQ